MHSLVTRLLLAGFGPRSGIRKNVPNACIGTRNTSHINFLASTLVCSLPSCWDTECQKSWLHVSSTRYLPLGRCIANVCSWLSKPLETRLVSFENAYQIGFVASIYAVGAVHENFACNICPAGPCRRERDIRTKASKGMNNTNNAYPGGPIKPPPPAPGPANPEVQKAAFLVFTHQPSQVGRFRYTYAPTHYMKGWK